MDLSVLILLGVKFNLDGAVVDNISRYSVHFT